MPERTRRKPPAVALVVLGLLAFTVVTLLTATRPAPDRVQELSERLRCPVCKSVSVAESPSETAVAIRRAVSDQVAAGRTDEEIVDFFRARYGDWVLLDPPTRGTTLLLWLAPLAVAVAGAALVWARARPTADEPATPLPEPARVRIDDAVARMRADAREDGDEP